VFLKLRSLLVLSSFLAFKNVVGQRYTISGKITNTKLEPLAYASVRLAESQKGTTADKDGNYILEAEAGKYNMVFSIVGYKAQVVTIAVTKNYTQNIIMQQDVETAMSTLQITSIKKDKAEEYIRNVIRHKDAILSASEDYTCNVYIKASTEDDFVGKKKKKDTVKVNALAKVNLTEVYLKLDVSYPSKIKEERTGIKKRGNTNSLFFLTTTDGDFNFYKNLVKLPSLAAIPMLSPISYSGLIAYKFKTIGTKKQQGRNVYTIKITPTKLGNALVSGEIDIMDSAWVILRTHFEMPKFHLVEYDFFSVDQQYEWINNKAWMVTRQEFLYLTKAGKNIQSGKTVAAFSNYNVDTSFAKKYFNTEVSSTAEAAYERDSSFWQTVRAEPLTEKEVQVIRYRDSVVRAHTTTAYLDSVEKKNNRITFRKLFIDGVNKNNWRKERTVYLGALPDFYQPFNFGGVRLGYNFFLAKKYKNKKFIALRPQVTYGLRNKDLQGNITFSKLYNPFSRGTYTIDVGRSFASIFEGDALINQATRRNFYLRDAIDASHQLELLNGLVLQNRVEFAARKSLVGYKTNNLFDSVFNEVGIINQPQNFSPHNALYNSIALRYTPRQKYIREPKEKIILGSSWPTFSVTWRKGIKGIFNSVVDFDYLEFGVSQKIRAGLAGDGDYSFISGSFLSKKDLRLPDYKFMRRGDPGIFFNPTRYFQGLDSTFAVLKKVLRGALFASI
jgi:hypothetical protein